MRSSLNAPPDTNWRLRMATKKQRERDEARATLLGIIKPGRWDDDKVQFARLLCELVANCENLQMRSVAESMDLSVPDVQSIYDRAHIVWENAKGDEA